jgi:hypothetical protein
MTITLIFEIIDKYGNALTCRADADNAVKTILALLELTGSELMLDTEDWRDSDWYDGRNVFTSTEIIVNDLEATGSDVFFCNYLDITTLLASGAWLIRNHHAYCIAHWPIGKARKHSSRRGDFRKVRKLYPVWLRKLKQLERLGNQQPEKQEITA